MEQFYDFQTASRYVAFTSLYAEVHFTKPAQFIFLIIFEAHFLYRNFYIVQHIGSKIIKTPL